MSHHHPQHITADLLRQFKRARGPRAAPFRGGRPSKKSRRQQARAQGRELEAIRALGTPKAHRRKRRH